MYSMVRFFQCYTSLSFFLIPFFGFCEIRWFTRVVISFEFCFESKNLSIKFA